MIDIFISAVNTKIGRLHIASSEKGITHITLPHITTHDFKSMLKLDYPNININKSNELIDKAILQLTQYFEGTLIDFSIPLDMHGTSFQKKVLTKVSKIRYGTTKTYGQIANETGSPKAYRAVGSANAKNRIPIIIPCHRVVASNSLGGYAGGVKLKEKLLVLEQKNSHI